MKICLFFSGFLLLRGEQGPRLLPGIEFEVNGAVRYALG